MQDFIQPTAPFDFKLMLQRPLSRPSKVVRIDVDEMVYQRALRVNHDVVPVTITSQGTVDSPVLCIDYPDDLLESQCISLLKTIKFMFSTNRNLASFASDISIDNVWANLVKRLHGLRPILDADLFESMVRTIIGQQLNVQFAATLVERLVDLSAETVLWDGRDIPVFPSAERVASWSYDVLRALSFSQRKAEYVIDFAKCVVNGTVNLPQLKQMSDNEVFEVLLPLRGIGHWTVECFLLFGMGREDLLPAADIGVQNAVKRLYDMPIRPSADEIRKMGEAWRPWRSYATYYLWQSLV